jgi:hypothetical protein
MPTNKLWIEHTERAAWESVEALREKLADAEKRMQRMAPPVAGWRGVFDALERAGQEHALPGTTYAEWMASLVERLEQSELRARSLEQELSRARESGAMVATVAPADPPPRREVQPYLDDDEDFDPPPNEGRSRSLARFFAAMQRRYRAQVRDDGPSDLDALIAAIEAKVDDLAELDEPELADAAVDMAVLALRMEREVKRR